MPWPAGKPHPTVSIVMTLLRHRGHLPEAIASWLTQTYPHERLELVLAANGQEPRIERKADALLANAGRINTRLLRVTSASEMELYDFAARQATGEWLLFTEPHCVARRDCVAELIGALESRGLAGGCVRTLSDGNRHWAARIEARLYQEDAANWTRDEDWRKFTKRGFALRSGIYRSVGGLEHRFGWFAETAMAARLHARGHRLGFVPAAAVKHYNSTDIGELLDYVWQYQGEMCAYAQQCDESLRPYFPAMAGDSKRPPAQVVRATNRAIRTSLIHALRRSHTTQGRSLAAAMLAEAIRWQAGPGAAYALRYCPARLRLAWPWQSEDRRYRAFLDVWQLLAQWATATYEPGDSSNCTAAPLRGTGRLDVSPGEIERGLYGYHAREEIHGRSFRWTGPTSSVLLEMTPKDYELSLDTGNLRAISPALPVQAFFNGRRLPPIQGSPTGATIRIPRRLFVADSPHVLTFTCPPLPTTGASERRALGLPIFGLHFRPLAAGSVKPANELSRAA
jgi:glycosyltransferase involved in cell wall biosynthesis